MSLFLPVTMQEKSALLSEVIPSMCVVGPSPPTFAGFLLPVTPSFPLYFPLSS